MERINEGLLTQWKVWSTMGSWLSYLPTRFLFMFNDIPWGPGWRFYGMPVIQKHRKSTMKFGRDFQLRSTRVSNPGINHPVVLSTIREGAILEIGDNFGMSGGGIVVTKQVIIGNNVLFGANTMLGDSDFHPLSPEERLKNPNDGASKPVIIEDNVFTGANVIILKGAKIGHGSVIGANSVVFSEIPPNVVAVGNPARPFRELLREPTQPLPRP